MTKLGRAISIFLIGSGLPAMAQAQAVSADQAGATESAQANEIIVTAQKRAESLQKTPVAITVVNNEAIVNAGVTDIRGLSKLVPAARFNVENNVSLTFLRGVGTGISTPFVAEAVGLQVNGVYHPVFASGVGLFDLQQVEVLPGPQGTLYGRAAIGGVTNIVTRRPDMNLGMDATLEGGNYDAVHFTSAANVPLSDKVAVRAALDVDRHDGFNSNGTDNKNAVGTRLSILAKPSDDLSIYVWGGYHKNNSRPSNLLFLPAGPGGLRDNDSQTNDVFNHNKVWQIAGQVDWTIGGLQISYIPGYVRNASKEYRDILGFPTPTDISGKQFSNELRFSNARSGGLDWLLAFYQFHNSNHFFYTLGQDRFGNGLRFAGTNIDTSDDTYAAFGQVTYPLTDALRVTLGGRYSWERLKADNGSETYYVDGGGNPVSATFGFRHSWERLDWKAGIEADIGRNSLLYANAQTGFNPGSFLQNYPVQGQPVKPQKMIGFTAGSKNKFGPLQANLEVFYYRYTDQIIESFDPAVGTNVYFNAPKSRMYGAELSTVWAVGPNTRINFTGAYLNAKMTEFSIGATDYSGYRLPFSPKWTALLGFEQQFPLASGAVVKFRADAAYNDGYWNTFGHNPVLRQKDFTKTDLNLSYLTASENLEIGAWVRNLEDSVVKTAAADLGPGAGAVYLEAPRTYGLRVRTQF